VEAKAVTVSIFKSLFFSFDKNLFFFLQQQHQEPEDAFFCFMFGVGFMLLVSFLLCILPLFSKLTPKNKEIMAPMILLMFVLHPLRHLIKSIIGIAFSLVYYSTDITIYFIEKLMSSINWAGKKGAWLVVSALPILVCTIVGYSLFSSKFCFQAHRSLCSKLHEIKGCLISAFSAQIMVLLAELLWAASSGGQRLCK
jgi:hypothetical protein